MNPLPKDWRETAQRIQTEVNALPYKSDPERYGKREFWEHIDAQGGDCEDYAIGKLNALHELGFPIERLRLATCMVGWRDTQYQEGHAVLVLDAPDDHYVLDNRFPSLVPVSHLIGSGYSLDRIQKVGGSREWIKWVHN